MNIGQFKQSVRIRCNNNPLLTITYLENLVLQIMLELASKGLTFKKQYDLTAVADTYTYTLPDYYVINRIEYGSAADFAANEVYTVDPKEYTVSFNDTATIQQEATLHLFFNPTSGNIIRLFYDSMNEPVGLSLATANDGLTLNTFFNPRFQQTIIDGVVSLFKTEIEASPTGQIAAQKYYDDINEQNSALNERVELL